VGPRKPQGALGRDPADLSRGVACHGSSFYELRMDGVLSDAGGDLAKIEKELGFDVAHFSKGGGLVRIDVPPEALRNLKTPSGLERGANSHFRYGGYTSDGVPETVVDPTPVAQVVIRQ
jgi:hypothetical protein